MQAVELNTFMMENVASKFHFREPTPNLPLVLLRIEISNCMGNNMLLYNPSNARKIPRYNPSNARKIPMPGLYNPYIILLMPGRFQDINYQLWLRFPL